ncbi:hypothetical protein AK812_SmicGene46090, partial [Symbiodinium microadriaticum]
MFNPNDIAAASVTIFLVILASMILMRSLTAYARARVALADQLQPLRLGV